ncbi:MAG: YraN family protein [Clostridia bacterium]|nr:YraN family protein [Clostridia bacterium]
MKTREEENDREFGSWGEEQAAKHLEKKGFRTVERNVFVGRKEIDIIAEGRGMILFVEVKTRRQIPDADSPYGRPATAVNAKKRENLLYAVRGYLFSHREACEGLQPRIDVVEVYADPTKTRNKVLEIKHFPNAVTAKRTHNS